MTTHAPNVIAAAKALLDYAIIDNRDHRQPDLKPTQWFVIDASKAEPEVNFPGDLISEHDSYEDARNGFASAIIAASNASLLAGMGEVEEIAATANVMGDALFQCEFHHALYLNEAHSEYLRLVWKDGFQNAPNEIANFVATAPQVMLKLLSLLLAAKAREDGWREALNGVKTIVRPLLDKASGTKSPKASAEEWIAAFDRIDQAILKQQEIEG